MSRIIFSLSICLFFASQMQSQVLGQDKEGFSSIILPSATFNVDLTDKVATLNYYQENVLNDFKDEKYLSEEECNAISKDTAEYKLKLLDSWKKQESNYRKLSLVFGGDLKGSSSDGISMLIKNEQLMTGATVSALIGLWWYKRVYDYKNLSNFAKMTFSDKNEDKLLIEKKLIDNIEMQVQKLAAHQFITASKKNDLLYFVDTKGKKNKIKVIEDRIISVEKGEGFITSFNDTVALNRRIKILDLLAVKIKKIESLNKEHDSLKKINTHHQFDPNINKNLEDQEKAKNAFGKYLENKDIELLKLQLDYKNSKWDDASLKVNNARETAIFTIYKIENKVIFSSDSLITAYKNYKVYLENDKSKNEEYIKAVKENLYSIQRNLFYFKGGFLTNSFKYDLDNDSTAIANRFIDKNFQGYRMEVGYTRQFKKYNFLGLNLAMSRTSNVEQLKSTTYKFEKTDTTVEPNITTGTEIKALSGDFDTFSKYSLSFDYVYLIPFHDREASEQQIKDSKLLLSINPYFRHFFYSNSETLKPNTSAGLGLYSFNKTNGSIAGGIFIQADDIFNVNRKQDINFTKQISVGIVVKVAIKSFDPVPPR